MDTVKNALNYIESFQCSDLKSWIEMKKFLLKKLNTEEARIAVKEFNENDFIDLNSNNFLREVKRENTIKIVEMFYLAVKDNIDYILYGSKDWETPGIVDVFIQIEKFFYPRLKSEIQKQIQQNIFQ